MPDMIDDVREKIKEVDSWLTDTRSSLELMDEVLEAAILILDDIRSKCCESIEGDVIKCMEHVRKAKEIEEDI